MIALEVTTTGFRTLTKQIIELGSIIKTESNSNIIPIDNVDYTAYIEVEEGSSVARLVELDRLDTKEIRLKLGSNKDRHGKACDTEDTMTILLSQGKIKTDKGQSIVDIAKKYDIQIKCEVIAKTYEGDDRRFVESAVDNMEKVRVKSIESLIIEIKKRHLNRTVTLATIYCGEMDGFEGDKVVVAADVCDEAWRMMNK